MDKMDVELKRKDSSIGVHTNEKRKLEELLQLEKGEIKKKKTADSALPKFQDHGLISNVLTQGFGSWEM